MITESQVKLAMRLIIQRKQEKNRKLMNDQKQPRFMTVATMVEIQKELESDGKTVVPPSTLERVLLGMVHSRMVVPTCKAYTLPSVMGRDVDAIEKNWGTGK